MTVREDAAENNLLNQQREENPQNVQHQAAQNVGAQDSDEFGELIPEEKRDQVNQEQRNKAGAGERDASTNMPESGNAGGNNEGNNIGHGNIRVGSLRGVHPERGGYGRGNNISQGNIRGRCMRGGHPVRGGYGRYQQPRGGFNSGPYGVGRAPQHTDSSGPSLCDLLPVENYISERNQNANYGGFDGIQSIINTQSHQGYNSNMQVPRGIQENL